jgi:hypothetical protein
MAWTPTVKQLTVLHQGANVFPYTSEWVDSVVLTLNTAASYNLAAARTAMGLPSNAPLFVVYGANGLFYRHCHATAAVPTGNTDGSSAAQSPNQEYLDASISAISFIAAQATVITLSFFKT